MVVWVSKNISVKLKKKKLRVHLYGLSKLIICIHISCIVKQYNMICVYNNTVYAKNIHFWLIKIYFSSLLKKITCHP